MSAPIEGRANRDDVDRLAREQRTSDLFAGILFFLLLAAVQGAYSFLRSESAESIGREFAWLLGSAILAWFLVPYYYEFRIRAQRIDAKVSAIERSNDAERERSAEIVKKLTSIEDRLKSMGSELSSLHQDR